jgi:hypothetical protein
MTIHVATVHWQDDRWIDVQLAYLKRHLPEPYKVYAFLNRMEEDHSGRFYYSSDEDIKEHSTKLNLLADLISFNAPDDDVILFIDGDAFPIADLGPLIETDLPRHELIAVKREEASDVQPHPCFCLTTVGFWKQLGGDWRKGGHHWTNAVGRKVSDVGVRVLKAVDEQDVDWKPLLRSNKNNPHPLFFGVYSDLVYHHGAGFREARGGRMAIAESGAYDAERTLRYRVINRLPRNKYTRKIRRRFDPVRKISKELKEQNRQLSAEWWSKIESDPEFYRELI